MSEAVDKYLGVKVTQCKPQEKPRRKKQLPAQVIRTRPKGYLDEPAERWEQLLLKMNVPGMDPCAVVANSGFRHDPLSVWGAIGMAHLPDHIEGLLVYMATGDRKARARAYTEIFFTLMYWAEAEDWDCRKAGVLDNMALVLIFDVADPHHFWHLSQRQWARLLDLADHKDWPLRWRARYQRARRLVAGWASEGINAMQYRHDGSKNSAECAACC